ncbi:MAG TPA: porin [Burkholderiaceae bacterium]|nr:porin [Burkholderiaceae bacterium]
MKKNLMALAVFGAFSGAALAQSNVTLYGIIDVNYQYNDPSSSALSSTRGINSGHQSGSRWGVRGTEAISPNLNAVFTLEGGYSADTGTLGQSSAACTGAPVTAPCAGGVQSRLFGRQVWAGLSGGWGTFVAGRVATFSSGTGSFDMFGNTDPFLTGFGDSALPFSSARALRLDNSVLYQSPTFGGFKFGVGHSFNASGPEIAGSGNNVDVTFTGASFATGPFFAALTWDRIDIPGAPDNQTNLQAGLTFDLKFLKLHAGYAKEDNQRVFNVAGITSGADADAWMGGITIPLLGGNILASYTRYDGDRVQLTPTTFDERDFKNIAVGFTYPLSRRTNVYATWNRVDGDHTINNSATLDRKQYTVGMRHLF